jgi:hypothetical protein
MLILFNDPDGRLLARRATAWERLLARALAASLDRQLAAGTAPEASPIHAVRALALVHPERRRSLARTLRRILDDAARPECQFGSRVVPPRRSILDAAGILTVLIDRLNSPEPVSACGAARLRHWSTMEPGHSTAPLPGTHCARARKTPSSHSARRSSGSNRSGGPTVTHTTTLKRIWPAP